MPWFRTTAALATGAALLLTPQFLPASAAQHSNSVRAVAPSQVAPSKLIHGVVVDQFGNPVDDVDVSAARPNGTRVASALSYASAREDGPQHGYFYLSLDQAGRGTYVVTVAKSGYRTAQVGRVDIDRNKQKVSLGEVVIEKVLPATTTAATVTRKVFSTRDQVRIAVTVSSRATRNPTGTVEIREGNTVLGSVDLTARDRGRALVQLGRLAKGKHSLSARFLGSGELAPSATNRPLTLVVVKSRR